MSSSLILPLIILAVLAGSLYYILQAEGGISQLPFLLQRLGVGSQEPPLTTQPAGTPPSTVSKVPPEFQSGNSRYSNGTCSTDADCSTGGCSGESCISVSLLNEEDGGFVTTCEFSPEFPNALGYSCGCVNKVCGWK